MCWSNESFKQSINNESITNKRSFNLFIFGFWAMEQEPLFAIYTTYNNRKYPCESTLSCDFREEEDPSLKHKPSFDTPQKSLFRWKK